MVEPTFPRAARSDLMANLDDGLPTLECHFRIAFLHQTDRHEVEAHSRNMEYLIQLDLARLPVNDDAAYDNSDARSGYGPLVTHRDAPSRGCLVVVEACAHPAHVCRRRRVDKRRLGEVIVVSRIVNKTDGVVAVSTVFSRNSGHLVLAMPLGLENWAVARDVPEFRAVVALDLGAVTTAALTSIIGADECHVANVLGRW